jgi:transcriptional regulator with XRE-family HTH domain
MNQLKLFGKRVRTVRKAAKITQEEAAEAARLNSKYLGEIERGEKRPSFEVIIALAKALKVPPERLFHFDREETDEKIVRKKVDTLLQKTSPQQLQLVYRMLKALLEV